MPPERHHHGATLRLPLLLAVVLLTLSPTLASAEEPAPTDAVPSVEEAAPEAKPVAGWNKGFFIQSPDGRFKLKIGGRVQARFTVESLVTDDGREAEAHFLVPRARFSLGGHLFTAKLTFKLEIDFGKGLVSPKKAFLDYAIVPGWLQVRAGHFKKPWSRHQLTSSTKVGAVDRAPTDKAFGAGYDLGVMLHNGRKQPLEWAVAFVNGSDAKGVITGDVAVDPATGEGEIVKAGVSNVPALFQPTLYLRGGYAHGGIDGYDESDRAGGPFRFAVGGGVVMSFDVADEQDGWFGAQVDAIVKVSGFSAGGAFYLATAQDGSTWSNQGLDQLGFHMMAGYLVKGHVQPQVRYARIVPLIEGGETTQELGGAVSVLLWGHNVKWVTDVFAIGGDSLAPADVDVRVRTQAQVTF